MSRTRFGLAVLTMLSLLGFAAAQTAERGPDATVRDAYAVTIKQLATESDVKHRTEPPFRPPHRQKLMSKRLNRLFARDEQFMKESGDEGNLGSDPFISGQDGGVEKLKVTVGSQEGDKATVFADFVSLGEQTRVEFSMIRENGRWVIDDITNTMEGKPFKIGDLLSQPYECGSFMKKPCKR